MSYTFGVLFFVIALLVSVMLHEAGHFLTPRACGMKASRFFVGFGPTLWSTHRGETEYGVKAIPAGGFVKIIGMTPLEEVEPGDEERVFYKQPPRRRLVVLAAGSVIHLLIAVLIIFGYLVLTHDDPIVYDLRVTATPVCIQATSDQSCTQADPRAPAYGVLHKGDVILSVNGKSVSSASSTPLSEVVGRSAGKPVTFLIQRGDQQLRIRLTPVPLEVDGKTIGRVGVSNELVPRQVSTAEAFPRTFR